MRSIALGMGLLAFGSVVACGKDDEPRAPADAIPEAAAPVSGSVNLGTVATRARERVAVSAAKLTKTPITVRSYRQCVASGVCGPPARTDSACVGKGIDGQTWTTAPEKFEDAPITCTTPDQAAKYCRWVGGRLPRIDEWELAARGTEVHRYPWGDSPPTCEQVARLQFRAADPALACGGSVIGEELAVAKHPGGRGAGVLEDVLVSRGEYVSGIESSVGASCKVGTTCVMRGGNPGAIEQMIPAGANVDLEAAGFRCAWSEQ